MPRGNKISRGYATIPPEWGGKGYREIAEAMQAEGHKMNHSTVRNIFLSGMRTFAEKISRATNKDISLDTVSKVSKDPAFQMGVAEILRGET